MSDKPAEQADHARGAGRDWRTLLASLVEQMEPFEAGPDGNDCCWCRRTRDRRIDSWQASQKPEYHDADCEFGIAVAALREPGADTGTTVAEELSGMLAERMIKLAIKIQGPYATFGPPESLERRKKSHQERIEELTGMLTTEFAECLERGTTPPDEGLALERAANWFEECGGKWDAEFIATQLRALAATQRAPVEQGRETPKPPSINANQTAAEQFHEDILSIYGARSQTALRVTCREIFERREREVLKAAAPDHAREGAVPSDEQAATDFLYGTHEKPTVAQVMILIRDIRKQSNAALNEAEIFIRGNRLVRPSQDETGRVGDIVRRALADGKEGGE